MERDRYPLATSREPNPLRPYYVPPSIGNTTVPASSQSNLPTQSSRTAGRTSSPSSSLGSSARDLFPEIDLDLKNTTSEAWQHTRSLLDTLAWRYMSVILAQPFDVTKTLLQISAPPSSNEPGSRTQRRTEVQQRVGSYRTEHSSARKRSDDDPFIDHEDVPYDDEDTGDSSDDISGYFSSTAPRSRSPRKRRRTPPQTSLSPSPTPTPMNRREQNLEDDYKLRLKRLDSINHVLSMLYATSGAVGWWRATNCTFLYSICLRTTDSFLRGLLLALVGLPEIISPEPAGLGPNLSVTGTAGFSGLDLTDSPNPLGSLIVVGLSSCITGILLAPLDLVHTRLIITPTFLSPRGLLQNLRRLPSLLAPSTLWLPTALLHTIPQVFSASAPLFLRRQMRITPETTPSLWSLAAFTTSLVDLFIRLPLETVARRAQVSSLKACDPELATIVEPASYTGVWPTLYNIMYLEGESTTKDAKGMLRTRRGQGLSGIVRGWRIGFWGLVGVWGAGAIGPGEGKGRGRF